MEAKLTFDTAEFKKLAKDKNVLVFSNYRTGSVALLSYLSRLLDQRKTFHEPFSDTRSTSDFSEIYQKEMALSKDGLCIINIQADQITLKSSMLLNKLIPNSILIYLDRYDFTKQVASLYIANMRNSYLHTNETPDIPNATDLIEIDPLKIKLAITQLNYKQVLATMPLKFDYQLYYEDIIPLLGTTFHKITPKPGNYNVLLSVIDDILLELNQRFSSVKHK